MSKSAYFVLGPESSGTKLTTEILIGAGCAGNATIDQHLDKNAPEGERVVFRRSYPHGVGNYSFTDKHGWPNLHHLILSYDALDYDIAAVVCMRDWYCITQSALKRSHTRTSELALENIRRAYRDIFEHISLHDIPYVFVQYEQVVACRHTYLHRILDSIGLVLGNMPYIYDGNAKYYD